MADAEAKSDSSQNEEGKSSVINSISSDDGNNSESSQNAKKGEKPAPGSSYTDYSHVRPEPVERGRGGKEPAQTFPMKLHAILSNPEFQDIIAWLPHGRAWRILQHKAFEEKCIPLYFRHGRYSSFARQVNGWGFRRITHGPDYNAYYHEMFLRGMPHVCEKMKRLANKDEIKKLEKEGAPPPDFYALSRDHPLPEGPTVPIPSGSNGQLAPAIMPPGASGMAGFGITGMSADMNAFGGGAGASGAGNFGGFDQNLLLQRMQALTGGNPMSAFLQQGGMGMNPLMAGLRGSGAQGGMSSGANQGQNPLGGLPPDLSSLLMQQRGGGGGGGMQGQGGLDMQALLRQMASQQQQGGQQQQQQGKAPGPSAPNPAPGPGGFDFAALLRQQQAAMAQQAPAPTQQQQPGPAASNPAPGLGNMNFQQFLAQQQNMNMGQQGNAPQQQPQGGALGGNPLQNANLLQQLQQLHPGADANQLMAALRGGNNTSKE